MSTYTTVMFWVLLTFHVFAAGILLAKVGQEKTGKYTRPEFFAQVVFCILFALALYMR